MKHKVIAATALAALLAACDSGADGANEDGRTAEGELLGGTIDDEMLPLDTVRSQSPPLRPEPTGEDEEGDAPNGAEVEAVEAPAEEAVDEEPEAEPEPEPEPDGAEQNQPPTNS